MLRIFQTEVYSGIRSSGISDSMTGSFVSGSQACLAMVCQALTV